MSVGIETVIEKTETPSSAIVGNFKEYTFEELEDAYGPYKE